MIHRPSPLWAEPTCGSPIRRTFVTGVTTSCSEARDGAWWDAGKIGLGPPPLETAEGWLILYHGVHSTADGPIYRAGLWTSRIRQPCCTRPMNGCSGRQRSTRSPATARRLPCGWTLDERADLLYLYYGAADSVTGLATARFSEVLQRLRCADADAQP